LNAYEITFIIRPDLDEEQTRAVAAQVTGRVESAGGEVIALYPWSPARRRMAYPIRDFGDGFYTTATFRFDPQALRDFENVLKLNENILRFLVVQASDQAIKQSQQRAYHQSQAASPQPVPASPTSSEPATAAPEGATPITEPSTAVAPETVEAVSEVAAAQATDETPVETEPEAVATIAQAEE